jgi:hypothetical protein
MAMASQAIHDVSAVTQERVGARSPIKFNREYEYRDCFRAVFLCVRPPRSI